jgi:hypothetical protein
MPRLSRPSLLRAYSAHTHDLAYSAVTSREDLKETTSRWQVFKKLERPVYLARLLANDSSPRADANAES